MDCAHIITKFKERLHLPLMFNHIKRAACTTLPLPMFSLTQTLTQGISMADSGIETATAKKSRGKGGETQDGNGIKRKRGMVLGNKGKRGTKLNSDQESKKK